ncbi:glycosyltransferase family 9 protein [Lonepinella koalarum]|uniref:glycosyltransferase family 9 protein n=1 Tax=Lonepinella koalarum TaxID=53417 RepID=UPI0011E43EA8|nr:glycosyltransferase family 9 protein [Lonepinella koalarum]TYG34278.1 glycosyltransferase family 9 protein [Lonepinella koalarum]
MQHLLVIRNDKIGDFMLIFPALALIKQSEPNIKITALVPNYTAPLAQLCPYIDNIIIDSKDKKNSVEFHRTLSHIKTTRFDAVISFVSDWYNAKLTWQSGIKYRLAPATKLFQFLYNHRLTQRRSRSEKAEFEYNMDLARQFLKDHKITVVESQPPYLVLAKTAVQNQRILLSQQLNIDQSKKWLFVHSGTGGSANSLSLNQYVELIHGILAEFDCHIVLTAGPNESEKAHQLAEMVSNKNIVIYDQNNGLQDFTHSLACADLFIAGSTGPLHICGALNIPTIGFYPSRLSAIPRRWRPINQPDRHIAFCPPFRKEVEKNLTVIPIQDCLKTIIPFMQQQWGVEKQN